MLNLLLRRDKVSGWENWQMEAVPQFCGSGKKVIEAGAMLLDRNSMDD